MPRGQESVQRGAAIGSPSEPDRIVPKIGIPVPVGRRPRFGFPSPDRRCGGISFTARAVARDRGGSAPARPGRSSAQQRPTRRTHTFFPRISTSFPTAFTSSSIFCSRRAPSAPHGGGGRCPPHSTHREPDRVPSRAHGLLLPAPPPVQSPGDLVRHVRGLLEICLGVKLPQGGIPDIARRLSRHTRRADPRPGKTPGSDSPN